jgi:hypothetical protein
MGTRSFQGLKRSGVVVDQTSQIALRMKK